MLARDSAVKVRDVFPDSPGYANVQPAWRHVYVLLLAATVNSFRQTCELLYRRNTPRAYFLKEKVDVNPIGILVLPVVMWILAVFRKRDPLFYSIFS